MLAFRDAHAARDAKTKVDVRNEHGERVIAGRRANGRAPISEAALRKEVARDLETLMNTVALEFDGRYLGDSTTCVVRY